MGHPKPLIFCLGISFRSAGFELRESLYLDPEQLRTSMVRLAERWGLAELMVLSTCNRLEIYGVCWTWLRPAKLSELFGDLQELAGRSADHCDWRESLYIYLDDAAVRHALRVVSSLDSLVVGETQITGQFKQAVALAAELDLVGTFLGRLTQQALKTAKLVRSKTDVGKSPVSIAHAAVALAKKVYSSLRECTVVVVGTGEMSRLAALRIAKELPQELYVVNRTVDHAQALIEEVGCGRAGGLADLEQLLAIADVVFCATAATDPVVTSRLLTPICRERADRSLFIADMAIPRDVEANCGAIDNVYLFQIDDLQAVVGENAKQRQGSVEQAQGIVKQGVTQFGEWLGLVGVQPVLAGLQGYLSGMMRRELLRTVSRSRFSNLNGEQHQGLQAFVDAIVGKVVGDAARVLKDTPTTAQREHFAEAMRLLTSATPAEQIRHGHDDKQKNCDYCDPEQSVGSVASGTRQEVVEQARVGSGSTAGKNHW